jgi:hypothetical protein
MPRQKALCAGKGLKALERVCISGTRHPREGGGVLADSELYLAGVGPDLGGSDLRAPRFEGGGIGVHNAGGARLISISLEIRFKTAV